jgi:hypothetical protein
VHAGEARGQGRRVVGDHEIARTQQVDEGVAPRMRDRARRVHDQ